MENMDNLNWEDFSPTPEDTGELKKIQKSIRKRHWLTVLTSVVLVAVLIFGAVQYGIPALESRYWDPETKTYSEYLSDFDYAVQSCMELFFPHTDCDGASVTKTGFASYELRFYTYDTGRTEFYDRPSLMVGNIEKNKLTMPMELITTSPIFDFAEHQNYDKRTGISKSFEMSAKKSKTRLAQLPEYVKVRAAVSFSEEKNMNQLSIWGSKAEVDCDIGWVGIRVSDTSPSNHAIIGMKPFSAYVRTESTINDSYEDFHMRDWLSGERFEAHFKSLLQYSLDQYNDGKGFAVQYSGENIYQDALDYVEENGVYTYGCYITASPSYLLKLLNNGTASHIIIQDAWFDV